MILIVSAEKDMLQEKDVSLDSTIAAKSRRLLLHDFNAIPTVTAAKTKKNLLRRMPLLFGNFNCCEADTFTILTFAFINEADDTLNKMCLSNALAISQTNILSCTPLNH